MGEIADMMLNGCLCEGCGEYMGEGDGFPRRCAGCQPRPVGRAKPARRASSEPLAGKLIKRLREVQDWTDKPSGMYPGLTWDTAPAQFAKLHKRGLIATYSPHNPVHKERAVITNAGRKILASLPA